MAWYLHVSELTSDRWICRHGADVYDWHTGLAEAVSHLSQLASTMQPAEIFVHRLDGTVERIDDP